MSDGRPLQGVVLSGGGADGAYGVGVLKALCAGRSPATNFEPLCPDIFTGTSIGSFNAAFLTAQWDEFGAASVANLEDVWLNRLAHVPRGCGNGVYRIRGNPFTFADPGCYLPNPLRPFQDLALDSLTVGWDGLQRLVQFATAQEESLAQRSLSFVALTPFVSTEPLQRLLREVIDYRLIQRSSRVLRVVATNWATGELQVFDNRDMTANTGPAVVAASSAIPGFFPPIDIGAQPYVDGSVLMNTPLRPAIRAGVDVLHVIYLDPEVRAIPISQVSNFPEAYYRIQQIAWANNVNDDINDAAEVNRGLALAGKVLRNIQLGTKEARGFFDAAGQILTRVQTSERPLRPITIRRYRPHDPLSGVLGLLNFDRDRIEALIQRGFEDAVNHDPLGSQDVVPEVLPPLEEAATDAAPETSESSPQA